MISSLRAEAARQLISDGTVKGGMIPKVRCCLEVLERGVRKGHIINGRKDHAILLELLTKIGVGTEIIP